MMAHGDIHSTDVVCVATGAGSSSAQGRGSDVLAGRAGVGTGDEMGETGVTPLTGVIAGSIRCELLA